MKRTQEQLTMKQIRAGERKDDCKGYNSCLQKAAIMNYSGFTCEGCKKYRPTKRYQPDRQSRIFTPLATNWI